LVSKASDDSVSSTQATLDAARDEASKSADKVLKEGSKSVDTISATAEKNQSKAVDHILKTMSSL
jgi:vacuolar-type H+-ATPase subunit H